MPKKKPTGFTLIELMTALGVLTALVGVSVLALGGIKKRGNFSSATGELVANLRRARTEAYGRGTATVFIVDTVGNRWWSIEDLNGTFVPSTSLSTFNPANPAPAGFNLIASNTFPTGVTFSGASNGYGTSTLPAPYGGIAATAAPPGLPYCTFCVAGGANPGFGAVRFEASGGATFSAGTSAIGQSMSIAGNMDTGHNVLTIGIVAKTGASESFQVYQ